ncbi:MAG: SMP-30/gluconolactonase/LRE family protein [Bacteroidota bacterium]
MAYKVKKVKNTPLSILAESPVWHPEEKVLYWVDIVGGKLFSYDPRKEETRTVKLGSMVGAVVPASGEYSVIVALETGVFGLTLNEELKKLSNYPENEIKDNRFNDGKCDPAGRFWIGTMNKNVIEKAGNLYVFNGNNLELKQPEVTISNGIAWSIDHKTMYYIDTAEYAVFAYDFDYLSGVISNRRIAIKIPEDAGAPDGMTIDSNGMLWVAHWGGFAVRCWDPGTGKIVDEIDIPAPHVTSCTFGGENLNTLYITTASEGLSEAQIQQYPLSGAIFKVELNVKGVSNYLFKNTLDL